MKIVIYGISRSGKDFLISEFVQKNPNYYHLKGTETLKLLSKKILNKNFDETSENEKVVLRLEFANEVILAERKYGNVIVDGHYAFFKDKEIFNIVFTDKDKDLYDAFIYLKPSVEKVIENQKKLKDGKEVRQYSRNEIELWQNFEIIEMQKVCKQIDKELIVIDDCLESNLSFLQYLTIYPQIAFPRETVKNLLIDYSKIIKSVDTVLITDCDKTISIEDTSELFFRNTNIKMADIKKIFEGDYYTVYQFYKFFLLLKEVEQKYQFNQCCNFALHNTRINQKLYEDISDNMENVLCIGLTTGIFEIWNNIRNKIDFPQILFGNKLNCNGIFITSTIKRMMVEEFINRGKKVIAIGDGILDIAMLEKANKSYLVAQQKLSVPVIQYLSKNKSSIKQLQYNDYKYEKVEIVDSIWD